MKKKNEKRIRRKKKRIKKILWRKEKNGRREVQKQSELNRI